MSTYRICDWSHHFENSSSRKLKRLDWVAIPNSMDVEGYIVLVDHPNGAAHFGAWIAIVEIASKQNPRGTLPNGKTSQSLGGICQSLGRISRLPAILFEEALPRLIEIGFIEILGESADALGESPSTSAESATTLGKSADTDIHTGRTYIPEGKGTDIEKSSSSLAKQEISLSPAQNGNGWHAFVEAYEQTGRENTEADFKNCAAGWKKLGLADQIACVAGVRRDIERQKYSGPEFWPKPKKYVFEREWERKTAPRKTKERNVLEGVFDA